MGSTRREKVEHNTMKIILARLVQVHTYNDMGGTPIIKLSFQHGTRYSCRCTRSALLCELLLERHFSKDCTRFWFSNRITAASKLFSKAFPIRVWRGSAINYNVQLKHPETKPVFNEKYFKIQTQNSSNTDLNL